MLAAWWLTDGDEVESEAVELDDDEGEILAAPIGRIFARTALNRKYGRGIVDSDDILDAGLVAFLYARTIRPLYRAKMERERAKAAARRAAKTNRAEARQEDVKHESIGIGEPGTGEANGALPFPIAGIVPAANIIDPPG